ncbi:type III-A CRISPR-associated protein Csm2 [Rhodothermus marinus]|uniref:type III-A CRISPR-associated protein Csm2 n=1 Tax=Rhodothermus marinus TaxID=29549 RepID=UPI000321A93F|nr:type III-A CRISPR-associated protein Csm2 [Rhodothermus marinus]
MPTKFTINGQEIDGQEKVVEWIRDGLNREAILYAERFGRCLAGRDPDQKRYSALTTSQIRNIYGEVERMRMKGFDLSAMLLLKPRLTYATSRNATDGSKDFNKVFIRAIDAILEAKEESEQAQRFERFADFFEAVLAYHRAYGGK